jgi:predicted ferric reductase
MTALGRLTGFTGAYLILIMVVLMARLPWLESTVGQDRLARWHRRVSPWAIGLITAHVLLITIGYAQAARSSALGEAWLLLTSYRDMLAAAVGFSLLILAGITSYRAVRRRLRYETWWVVHLYLYIGLALAFAHQIFTGVSFIGHPLIRAMWIAIWLSTVGLVLVFRVGQPAWRSMRHQLRVVEVRDEAPGVVSVICQGRHLDKLAVSGGQFFLWRFWTRELWWQAHPYSLSALPQPPYLRVTVKGLGDSSRALASLRPGTRIAFEGPYGAFTDHARLYDGVLLVAAGVGITPLRALLEDLPASADVVVIARASTPRDLVHRNEIAALVKHRNGRLHELIGSRHKVRLTARTLRHLVPDVADRDVYICGPEGFGAEVVAAAAKLGVADDQIHIEAFGF